MSATEGKSERDLLELAAKAAGHNFNYRGLYGVLPAVFSDDGEPTKWDPLTDDGDALRLAVRLRLIVNTPSADTDCALVKDHSRTVYCDADGDIYESTRRAIVLAAAALGSRE